MKSKLLGIYKLTRIKEIIGFTLFPISLGIFTANAPVNLVKIILIFLAALSATAFGFMINDVEDAEDDSKDPKKVTRNPISAKLITKKLGYLASFSVALISLLLFALFGLDMLLVGFSMILGGFLYSWKKVRFKNLPLIDFISHSYIFGGALVMSGYLAFTHFAWDLLIPALAISAFSAAGDLYNEIRDFTVDRKTNLKNTASFLGEKGTLLLKNIFILIAFTLFAYLIFKHYQLFSLPIVIVGIMVIAGIFTYNIIVRKAKITEFDDKSLYTPFFLTLITILLVSIFLG